MRVYVECISTLYAIKLLVGPIKSQPCYIFYDSCISDSNSQVIYSKKYFSDKNEKPQRGEMSVENSETPTTKPRGMPNED